MAGSKIGQISDMSSYKVESQIDEHYIDRVVPGLTAKFERQGDAYQVCLRKVYPEVHDGRFKADFKFADAKPENVRPGQTYYLDLQLGQPTDAVIVPRGSFFQHTGGKWIYVLSPDGTEAVKRPISIGRQNPVAYEVTAGLSSGEKVLLTGYETFADNDRLILQNGQN